MNIHFTHEKGCLVLRSDYRTERIATERYEDLERDMDRLTILFLNAVWRKEEMGHA